MLPATLGLLIGLSVGDANASTQVVPCGTPAQMHRILAHRPRTASPVAPPSPDLTERDSFGTIPNIRYSEHFALKWGDEFVMTEAQIEATLASFEFAWSIEVVEWDMLDPTGVDGTYFNVYIGDSGSGVPSVNGNAGYYTFDEEGYPMIVIAQSTIESDHYSESVIAHEFFHAVQGATGAFLVWDTAGWYWEASATWAQGEVSEHWSYYSFLPYYALQPDEGLYQYSYDDHGGAPPDLHQYGAFIYLRYLSEHLDHAEVVRQSWREGGESDDPVEQLDAHLGEVFVGDTLVDHAARMHTWEYADGPAYSGHVEEVASWWPESDERITELVEHHKDDWYTVSASRMPESFGYNVIPLDSSLLVDGVLSVLVKQDVPDGIPSSIKFRARVVEQNDESVTYHTIDPGTSSTLIEPTDPSADLWLIVANVTYISDIRGSKNYRVTFIPVIEEPPPPEDTGGEPPGDTGEEPVTTDTGEPEGQEDTALLVASSVFEDDDDDEKGCGCGTTRRSPGALVWLLALSGLLWRRRSDTAVA